jgi:hypothetical protein
MKYLVLFSLLSFAACRTAPTEDQPKNHAGFDIDVRKAPISPIELEGVDNSAPLPGAPIHIAGTAIDTTVISDPSGHIFIQVPFGTYAVTAMELPDKWPSPPEIPSKSITFTAPDTLHWSITYETHIK